MLIGTIDNIDNKSGDYHPTLKKVLQYLRDTDFSQVIDGDYKIGEKGIIAKVQRYETRLPEKCKPETHNKFIDVQFIADGEEMLGWCPLSPDLEIAEKYNFAKDVTFYKKLIPESCVVLSKRHFAVLYPVDVHRPCGSLDDEEPSKVTKVVVKIPVELLN